MRLRHQYCRMAATFAVAFMLCAPVLSRDVDGEYKAQGLGLDACSSFLSTPEQERALYYSWIAGYLTAYNYLVRNTYSIAEYSGLVRTSQWFDKYCGTHPSHLLHEATRQFVSELYRVRVKRKPEPDDDTRFRYYTPQ